MVFWNRYIFFIMVFWNRYIYWWWPCWWSCEICTFSLWWSCETGTFCGNGLLRYVHFLYDGFIKQVNFCDDGLLNLVHNFADGPVKEVCFITMVLWNRYVFCWWFCEACTVHGNGLVKQVHFCCDVMVWETSIYSVWWSCETGTFLWW